LTDPKEKPQIKTRSPGKLTRPNMFAHVQRRDEPHPIEAIIHAGDGIRPVESASLLEAVSPPESTSLAETPPLALRDESLVESVSPVESTSLMESTVDFWAALTEWKEGFQQIPNMVALVLYRHLNPAERAVYGELFQLSWGFGNRTCKVSLPRLAERSGMKQTATHEAVKRLVSKGLVLKSQMDFGKGKDQGIIYSLPLPARLVESIRLTRNTSPTKSVSNKVNTQKENTQTQEGVRACSKFSLEDCRSYAEHLRASGQGINNPGGYATTIHRTGEADELIEAFLNPAPARELLDASQCPDCQGTGFYYPKGIEQGVAKCPHERLKVKG
jgi:predicted transcriptional regulator